MIPLILFENPTPIGVGIPRFTQFFLLILGDATLFERCNTEYCNVSILLAGSVSTSLHARVRIPIFSLLSLSLFKRLHLKIPIYELGRLLLPTFQLPTSVYPGLDAQRNPNLPNEERWTLSEAPPLSFFRIKQKAPQNQPVECVRNTFHPGFLEKLIPRLFFPLFRWIMPEISTQNSFQNSTLFTERLHT